jgi:uncharacterized coiled-coil protein SlyX
MVKQLLVLRDDTKAKVSRPVANAPEPVGPVGKISVQLTHAGQAQLLPQHQPQAQRPQPALGAAVAAAAGTGAAPTTAAGPTHTAPTAAAASAVAVPAPVAGPAPAARAPAARVPQAASAGPSGGPAKAPAPVFGMDPPPARDPRQGAKTNGTDPGTRERDHRHDQNENNMRVLQSRLNRLEAALSKQGTQITSLNLKCSQLTAAGENLGRQMKDKEGEVLRRQRRAEDHTASVEQATEAEKKATEEAKRELTAFVRQHRREKAAETIAFAASDRLRGPDRHTCGQRSSRKQEGGDARPLPPHRSPLRRAGCTAAFGRGSDTPRGSDCGSPSGGEA